MAVKRRRTPSVKEPAQDAEAPVDPRAMEILQRLEDEVQVRVNKIKSVATSAAAAIQNHFRVQLLKLPKKVRSMPVTQFREEFSGDIAAAVLQDLTSRLEASKVVSSQTLATALKNQRDRGAIAETPAVACTTRKRKAMTEGKENSCMGNDAMIHPRAPVLGEMAFSAQGSPLGKFEQEHDTRRPVLNTVLKGGTNLKTPMPGFAGTTGGAVATVIRRDGPGSKCGLADAIVVTTKDGSQIAVDLEGGLAAVPAKQRREVQEQLEALRRLADSALGTVRKK
eukprot:jgi/Botrbrau1/17439/Bobra.0054s0029.1